jgi:hypothetical protein
MTEHGPTPQPMNEPYHYCSACRRNARFITNHRRERQACALCYTEFPLDWSFAAAPPASSSATWFSYTSYTLDTVGLVLLVLLGVPALGLAVLFVGCVALSQTFH